MATFLKEGPRTPDIRINLVVGHRAFPVLDDAFGGPDVTECQQGFDHDRRQGR